MTSQLYQVNDALTIIPDQPGSEPRLAVENVDQKRKFALSNPAMLEILDRACEPTARADLIDFTVDRFGKDRDAVENLLDEFLDRDFLVRAADENETDSDQWRDHGWEEARAYYRYIRDYPFVDYAKGKEAFKEDMGRMHQYVDEEPIPPNYKTYDDADVVDLPSVDQDDPLPSMRDALDRIDDPTLGGVDLDVEDLAAVLYYCFGQTGTVEFPIQGEFLLKTSPSGGARHPTEAYVAVFDVEGVPPGIYHYSVKDHCLEIIEQGDYQDELADHVGELRDFGGDDPSFLLALSSVVARSMWRYREPRTYRIVQHDVGHLTETVRLVGNAFGLRVVTGHEFDDVTLADRLGITPFEEPLFRVAVAG